jgi:hypothetical protein
VNNILKLGLLEGKKPIHSCLKKVTVIHPDDVDCFLQSPHFRCHRRQSRRVTSKGEYPVRRNSATAWSDFSQRLSLSMVRFAEDETSTLMTSLAQEQLALVSGGQWRNDGVAISASARDAGFITAVFYTDGISTGMDDYENQVCRPLIP